MSEEDRLQDVVRRYYADPAELKEYSDVAATGLTPLETALTEKSFERGSFLLDIGCGAGREAIGLARLGFRVVGMDFVEEMVALAKRNAEAQGQRIDFTQGNVLHPPFEPGHFDGAVMFCQVISCIPLRQRRIDALAAVLRIIKPGGRLAMVAHNRDCHPKFAIYFAIVNSWRRFLRRLGFDSGLEDFDRWSWGMGRVALSTPLFFHMYNRQEAEEDLRSAGFEVLDAPPSKKSDYVIGFIARRPA